MTKDRAQNHLMEADTVNLTLDRRSFLKLVGATGSLMAVGDLLTGWEKVGEAAGKKVTLTVAFPADIASLLPDVWAGMTEHVIKRTIYDCLLHYQTKEVNGKLYYDNDRYDMLIASDLKVSEDRKTLTWTIRDGWTFSNGKKIDAYACEKCFRWYFKRDSIGAAQMKVDGITRLEDVYAVDARTLVHQLTYPAPWGAIANYIQLLSIVDVDEIMKHATESDPYGVKWLERETVCSGPYKIEKWITGDQFVVTAREDYYKGKPKIDRIIFKIIPDPSTRYMMAQRGELDIPANLDMKDLEILKKDPNFLVEGYETLDWWYLGMNWKTPPFEDLNVRKAIAHAIPYEEIINTVWYNFATRLKSCYPIPVPGYDPTLWPYEYDLDKAKEYLSQSSRPKGFEVEMAVDNDNINEERTAIMIQDALKKIGINVSIQKMTAAKKWESLIARKIDFAVAAFMPWIADGGYHTHWNLLEDSFANFFNYKNPEADKIAKEFIYMDPKDPRRIELMKKHQTLLINDVHAVYLFAPQWIYPHRKNLKGFVYFPDSMPRFSLMEKTNDLG